MIPRKFPDIRLYAYCTISPAGLSYTGTLGTQTISVTVDPGIAILLQTAAASITPGISIAAMNVCSANLQVEVDNVVTTQGNTINGRIRAGVVNDFSGDVYNEKIISNTTLKKDIVSGGATQKIFMSLMSGAKYHTTRMRIQNESWKNAFDPSVLYVFMRAAHVNGIHVTGSSSLALTPPGNQGPSVQRNLIVDEGCEGMTIPSYAYPFVDTGDTSVQVTHFYVSVSRTAATIVTMPNFVSLQTCCTNPPPNMTWLCSVMYAYGQPGTTALTPLYTLDENYAPAIECEITSGVRCAGFSGLTGNTYLLTAEGQIDIPPVLRNPVDIYKHGYGKVVPQPDFLEEIVEFNSEETRRKRIRYEPLVINTVTAASSSGGAIWDEQPPSRSKKYRAE